MARLFGKNLQGTPVPVIQDQLLEKRPLPIGRAEFEAWSDRIIAGAMVGATVVSQKFALANMIMHLGPTESWKEDGYFISSLRKYAANEVAHAIAVETKHAAMAAEEKRLESLETPEYKAAKEAVKAAEERAKSPVASTLGPKGPIPLKKS